MSDTRDFAKIAVDALADKKAGDIRVIDISEVSIIADYFIIADGSSPNQLQAMCDNVDEKMHLAGKQLKQMEGNRSSTWILMDYGDIIIHIFDKDDRLFYDLERVWSDGREISIEDL